MIATAAETLKHDFGTNQPVLWACVVLVIVAALILVRAFKGPTVYDRILAMNAAGTTTVLIVCMICFIPNRPDFLDMALTYAILNFLATIAILKFVRHRRLG